VVVDIGCCAGHLISRTFDRSVGFGRRDDSGEDSASGMPDVGHRRDSPAPADSSVGGGGGGGDFNSCKWRVSGGGRTDVRDIVHLSVSRRISRVASAAGSSNSIG